MCAAGAQPCRPPPRAGLHRRGAPSPKVAQRLRLGDDCEFARPFHPGPQPRPRPANRRCWPPRGQRAVSVDSVCEQDAPGRARWRTSRHQRFQDRKERRRPSAQGGPGHAQPPVTHSQGHAQPPVTHSQARSRQRSCYRAGSGSLWPCCSCFLRSSGSANRFKCTDGKSLKRMEETCPGTGRRAGRRTVGVSRCHRGVAGCREDLPPLPRPPHLCVAPRRRCKTKSTWTPDPKEPVGPPEALRGPELDTLLRTSGPKCLWKKRRGRLGARKAGDRRPRGTLRASEWAGPSGARCPAAATTLPVPARPPGTATSPALGLCQDCS